MFSVSNISVHFNANYIFRDISFLINEKDRVGLVGKNGSGKSTILKVLARLLSPETGSLAFPSEATIGYLPQELKVVSKKAIFDEALKAFDAILKLKQKLLTLEENISGNTDTSSEKYLKEVQQYTDLTEKLNLLDANNIEAKTEKVLMGLGFKREEFGNSMDTFSYGWQMRVELAKILLKQPNLILLDEPTNHLDIESIQWLEEFLINYPGAVVIVSHDRALLDNITRRTIEISFGEIFDYKASYSDFVALRAQRIEKQTADFNNQQREVQQIERFIERFRYKNTKAKQVQSKIKQLEKLDEIKIDQLDTSSIHFLFPPAPPCGKIVVETSDLSKAYGDKLVFKNVDFVALRGEKIAFVGKNGEGKSTLSKIITGNLDYEGEFKAGHNVEIGYYAQNQGEMLDQNLTVFETIDNIAVGDIRRNIRGILGSFLFGEEDIDKKVKVLSGGEKARLSLAKLLLSPVNLLVLDEPTNHLDMQSKDILKNALLNFDGTLMVVSHDRDFLQGLTTKVIEFRNARCKEHIGDIYDFLRSRKLEDLDQLNEIRRKTSQINKNSSENKLRWEEKKQKEKELRKINSKISSCELEIEMLEQKITELDNLLADPVNNKKIIEEQDVYTSYENLKSQLEIQMSEWEKYHHELESLQNE